MNVIEYVLDKTPQHTQSYMFAVGEYVQENQFELLRYLTVTKKCSVHIFHLKNKLDTTIHRKAANIFTN